MRIYLVTDPTVDNQVEVLGVLPWLKRKLSFFLLGHKNYYFPTRKKG